MFFRKILPIAFLIVYTHLCFSECPVGDIDGNCSVGLGDLVVLGSSWLDEDGGNANLDGIGKVDIVDYAILAEHWGDVGYQLLINEFMADNSGTIEDPDEAEEYPDWIEIYNPDTEPVDIGGWYITDTISNPYLWQIPANAPEQTTVPPGGYLILWADGDTTQGPLHVNLKLSAGGEEIGLYDTTGNPVDTITFSSQATDESYGRYPNGGPGWQTFADGSATPGWSNGGESSDNGILINEIMYHPEHDELSFEPEPLGLEYIELFNTGTSAVDLSGWRFVDGVSFQIPADTIIGAGGYLVIAADSAAFGAEYPTVNNVVGGWTGKLSNKGEEITLVNSIGTVIDSVEYADEGDWAQRLLGPLDYGQRGWLWSNAHDGEGCSLELVCVNQTNEYGQNWKASLTHGGTPGRSNSVVSTDSAPIIQNVKHTPVVPNSSQTVTVTVQLSDDGPGAISAVLYWRVDTSDYVQTEYPAYVPESYTMVTMYDDGLHNDGQYGDGVFGATIPAQTNSSVIEFFVESSDGPRTRTWPAPSDVDGHLQQVTNMLYQVDDTFEVETTWKAGKQPINYIIMTESERARIEDIGDGVTSNEQYSDAQMNATFISVDGTDTKVRYAVGVRNRGEGSRRLPPNNYRVNFRHDRPWKNVKAIIINSKYTYLQLLGSAIFRMAGLPAAEATGIQVRVNGENLALNETVLDRMYGTYVQLEVIDSEFTVNHFPDNSGGNIYKASIYPQIADLTYQGTNPASYVSRGYSKGTNESENDWTDLFELTNVMDNEPDETYQERLEQVVDTEQWIRWYAVQALIGNGETNLGNGYGDDYQMYRGLLDPRFTLVTHDMDTILGSGDSDRVNPDVSIWRCIEPHSAVEMVAIRRFLQHPEYIWRYYAELKNLTETVFKPENMDSLIDSLLGGFVPEAKLAEMKQFVVDRNANVLSQIPQSFTVETALPTVNGFYQATTASAAINGTADATETRAVKVNGLSADWSGVQGTWSVTGVPLKPGINRVIVQTFDDPQGTGSELHRGYVDIWYQNGNESTLSGTLSGNTILSAASGPWHVTGDVIVPDGIVLTIHSGTTVFFDAGTGITVNGRLLAQGTDYSRIRLAPVPGGSSWDGITFENTQQDNQLTYLDMEYGDQQGESIDVQSSKVTMDALTWASTNSNTPVLNLVHPSAVIRNCIVPSISGTEPVHGSGLDGNEYMIFAGNTFGSTTGYNDIVDFTGGQRPGPIVQFYNNTWLGGGDDGPDLDGTDAHVEGNFFTNFHQTTPEQDSPSYAVATGDQSQVCIVRNIFLDNDHAALQKEDVYSWTQNNTIINSSIAAISFGEPFRSTPRDPGKGSYLDSNLFWNNASIFEHYFDDPVLPAPWGPYEYGPTGPVGVYRCLLPEDLPAEWTFIGGQNIDADPMFKDSLTDWSLLAASSGVGTGSNNQNIGADVSAGASISGEPDSITHKTTATLTVSGPGITHYKYRLVDNGTPGVWSSEAALPINADDFPVDPENMYGQINLSGLQNGHSYRVDVIGKNSAGLWQGQQFGSTVFNALGNPDGNSSYTWTVDTSSSVLRINEVLAANTSIDHEGSLPDMIELYYDGAAAIDLGGYRLTDNQDLPDKFVFASGTIMNPGDYLVIYADSDTGTSGIHTDFMLDSDGDDLYLSTPAGIIVDSVVFGMQLDDLSIGRARYDKQWTMTTPTFGSENQIAGTGDYRNLKLNEWLTDGKILFVDDWVELYNPTPWPIDMGGLYITDDPVAEPNKYQIRELSFIGAEGYTVFKADQSNASGHLPFNLSSDGEMLALYDADLNEIDKILYGPHMTDTSQGRSPIDLDTIQFFSLPTPGAVNPGLNITLITNNLIAMDDTWSYNQSGTDLGTSWRDAGYNDTAWPAGAALLYVESDALPGPKNTQLSLGPTTFYFRKHFTFSGDPADVDHLELSTIIDDGAVIYLNGIEVLKLRLSGTVTYSTYASSVGNAVLEYFSIPASALVNGDNVITVEVHQTSSTSSDIVFGLSMDAVSYTIDVSNNYDNDRDVLESLRISEIMYNPAADPNSEFIELRNIGDTSIDLEGVRFTEGIEFVFPQMTLDPGQFTVVVTDQGIFENRYGTQINVAGVYTGKLDNGGEKIVLKLAEPLDAAILRFEYKDGWYPTTDGDGHSLVKNDLSGSLKSWQDAESWRPSYAAGGTPGADDIAGITINEVLAHSHETAPDWIELYNPTTSPVDIGGWYLSDDSADLMKYEIAASTIINDGAYIVFYENQHFGSQFALSENGDQVYLSSAQDGVLTGYTVEVSFGASERGVTFGHYEKSDATAVFVSMSSATPESLNSGPKVGPVVISEIMYNPPAGGSYAAQEYEYLELTNITDSPVTLDVYDNDLDVTLGWQFTNGIDYTFPLGTTIPANSRLIVAKNPAAFTSRYGSVGVSVLGPFENDTSLSNGGELLELSMPGDTDLAGTRYYILVDSVLYDDDTPWPATPDGDGQTLNRTDNNSYGDDVINWHAQAPSPGI